MWEENVTLFIKTTLSTQDKWFVLLSWGKQEITPHQMDLSTGTSFVTLTQILQVNEEI